MTFDIFTIWGLTDVFIATTFGGLGGFLAYHWFGDRFAALNEFADSSIEEELLAPLKLDYRTLGNPVTWVQHAAWTATVSLMTRTIAHATPIRCRRILTETALATRAMLMLMATACPKR